MFIQFWEDYIDVFRSIATKFSLVIDYELKFVKMQFSVKSISL